MLQLISQTSYEVTSYNFNSIDDTIMAMAQEHKSSLYPSIVQHIEGYQKEFDQISADKKKALARLALFVEEKMKSGKKIELIFICTHNSRRSHISQLWAQAAAAYYKIPNVVTYSGGTEATAFNPRAVKAMGDLGFAIRTTSSGDNPIYEVSFDDSGLTVKTFSKRYDNSANPNGEFAAIMTCSHADQNCPFIPGAEVRISTPYDDPKDFDGTELEAAKYSERAHEIGRDLLFAFSLVNGK